MGEDRETRLRKEWKKGGTSKKTSLRYGNPVLNWLWENWVLDLSDTPPSPFKQRVSVFLWGFIYFRTAYRCWVDLMVRSYTPWLREYWIGLFWDLL